jgi:hypothetical protein
MKPVHRGRKPAYVVASILLVAGCSSSGEWVYNKPNTSAVQIDRDLGVCRKESTRGTAIVIMPSQRLDRDAMNRCMERKGYTVTFEK